jgi:2'-5' RNA ligase superfamily
MSALYVRGLIRRPSSACLLTSPYSTHSCPPEQITETVLSKVRLALSRATTFAFRLTKIGRFPEATYLAPEPSKPFVALTDRLVVQFPKYLPCGGKYKFIVPHLTIVQGEFERDVIEAQLVSTLPPGGIGGSCKEIVLIENSSGLWKHMHSFPLVAPQSKAANPLMQPTGRKRPAADQER